LAKPLLEVGGLTVRYGEATALRDVALTVETGERVILLGRNGAGKTTLLNAISGVVPIAAGTIEFGGVSVVGRPVHAVAAVGVAQVSEGRRVFPTMSVRDNLLCGGGWIGAARRRELFEQSLDLFPKLRERLAQDTGTLSGGERQMVLIARGLMLDPQLLLLDEAFQGLAPVVIDEVLAAVEKISELGVATLLVEQNTKALNLPGRVLILNAGRLVFSGRSTDPGILEQVKRAYLDEKPTANVGTTT